MNVYEIITEDIIKILESGTAPWSSPWAGKGGQPANLITKKPYRGINPWILLSAGYTSPYWLTFKQAKDLGGCVRKGEKARRVIFWKVDQPDGSGDGETPDRRFVLRYYSVFNVAQDGIDGYIPAVPELPADHDPIAAAEQIVNGYAGPSLDWTSSGAWYRPATDHVSMPPRSIFTSAEGMYSTLFHELAHSTGHSSRLNRPGIVEMAGFGSATYSREELIAELTAAYLMGHAGILAPQIEQSAAYLQSWIKALRGDARLIVTAAAGAQKAADYILGEAR